MARLTQRTRIEHVAQTIFDRIIIDDDFSMADARAINERDGWAFVPPGQTGLYIAHLTDWELEQAYALAQSGSLTWTDPRKTGRPPVDDQPRAGIFLEIPTAMTDAIEAARGETTRREWIETAIRQRLEREG